MEITDLNKRPNIEQNEKLNKKYLQFEKLLAELKKRELTTEIIGSINGNVELVNAIGDSETELKKQVRKSQSKILRHIEKDLKRVRILCCAKRHFCLLFWPKKVRKEFAQD